MDLKDLYHEIIVDHNRNPRNFGKPEHADLTAEGFNPLCGDRLHLYINLDNDQITDVKFDGSGCAISIASASLMTEAMKGKSLDEAEKLFEDFHHLITQDNTEDAEQVARLGKLAALLGVKDYPTRVKCATLCWHTLQSAMQGDKTPAKTE